jgi:Methyltransferase FkbM domain
MALSDKTEAIPFNAEAGHFNQGLAHFDPHATETVDGRSLDDELLDHPGSFKLLKIDVEGMELSVIRGARQFLAKHKPYLVIEYNAACWTLDALREALPFPVKIERIPHTFYETRLKIDDAAQLTGFNNLLLTPV